MQALPIHLYVDYVLSGSNQISAVHLSEVAEERYSHDQVTRMLSSGEVVTPSIDDSIQPRPYSDLNEVVNWHYDHMKGRCVQEH